MMIAARRNADEDSYYWRINQVMLPFYTPVHIMVIGGRLEWTKDQRV